MFGHFVSALVALIWSIRYQQALGVRVGEYARYWLKGINLALCYRGFCNKEDLRSLIGAGKAAFFCCAYDVITDWRVFDHESYLWFRSLLNREVSGRLARIALRLYEEERQGSLQFDGLSRGVDALEFVTGLIGSDEHIRQRLDFNHVGITMQIVDDVLDFEDDIRRGETNCLLGSQVQRMKYLRTLAAFDLRGFRNVLPHARVLCAVIRNAQRKAEAMMLVQRAALEELAGVNRDPYSEIPDKEKRKVIRDV